MTYTAYWTDNKKQWISIIGNPNDITYVVPALELGNPRSIPEHSPKTAKTILENLNWLVLDPVATSQPLDENGIEITY
jgi:hypothetical protein